MKWTKFNLGHSNFEGAPEQCFNAFNQCTCKVNSD